MTPTAPLRRVSLSDDLAQRIQDLIEAEAFAPDARLPTIADMAQRFQVGLPTLREALKKLETLGRVVIRHGSGVYVGPRPNTLFVSNSVLAGTPSRKTLLDLVEARLPLELSTTALAARHASDADLSDLETLLDAAGQHLRGGDDLLNSVNMSFHAAIAKASGNTVLHQLLDVVADVYQGEQRAILDIFGSRERDHAEHVQILAAICARDEAAAVGLMRAHLEGVREVLLLWDERTPVPAP